MIHACRGWPAIKNGIFGGYLKALELRKLNPASCHIPTLLSATAPPSPSIVYHPYGAIMPAFLRHRHHPLPNHNNHVSRHSFFPSISRTDRSMGAPPHKGKFDSYLAHLLSKPSLVTIGSHVQALAPSVIGHLVYPQIVWRRALPTCQPAVTAPVRTTFVGTVEFLNVSGVANVGIAAAVAFCNGNR